MVYYSRTNLSTWVKCKIIWVAKIKVLNLSGGSISYIESNWWITSFLSIKIYAVFASCNKHVLKMSLSGKKSTVFKRFKSKYKKLSSFVCKYIIKLVLNLFGTMFSYPLFCNNYLHKNVTPLLPSTSPITVISSIQS